jgi:hypothetical protein
MRIIRKKYAAVPLFFAKAIYPAVYGGSLSPSGRKLKEVIRYYLFMSFPHSFVPTGVRWHAVRHDGKGVSRKAEFVNNSG